MEAVLDIGIFAALLIYTKKQRPRGNVLFLYFLMYAVVRFCTELLRGDEIRGIYWNLSTSQWISLILIIAFFARKAILKIKKQKMEEKNYG